MKNSLQTVSFYTEGEGFTNLVHSFIKEGQFKKVYNILTDSNPLPDEVVRGFFKLSLGFKGDTRKGDLSIVNVPQPTTYSTDLFYAVRMALEMDMDATEKRIEWTNDYNEECSCSYYQEENYRYGQVLHLSSYKREEKYENYQTLLKFIPFEELIDIIFDKCVVAGKWELATHEPLDGVSYSDGIILENGKFILCGYQQHNDLYPFTARLGLSEGQWTECRRTLHVSGGTISGHVAYELRKGWKDDGDATEEQKKTLFRYRRQINGVYGGIQSDSISEILRGNIEDNEDFGGKYNNLTYLKTYYPQINLPKFHKEPLIDTKQCIRTSPKLSLAGLLTSKFDITKESVKEIEADFEKFKDVRTNNELHYFYQEFLEGANGVCHYWKKEEHFTYSVSENQGDIVQGKDGNANLSLRSKNVLLNIAKELATDLKENVQLEFVIHNKKVYIVQLRLLQNNHTQFDTDPTNLENIVGVGQTFSKGNITVAVEDILIVDSDTDSEALLGKKALIVKDDVEFSHVLALSKSLRIPSIFNIETLVLDGVKEVKFIAEGITAYITKIK
jgi:hypothetical protein